MVTLSQQLKTGPLWESAFIFFLLSLLQIIIVLDEVIYCYHMHPKCPRKQKITLDPLELELKIAVSHHVDADS